MSLMSTTDSPGKEKIPSLLKVNSKRNKQDLISSTETISAQRGQVKN